MNKLDFPISDIHPLTGNAVRTAPQPGRRWIVLIPAEAEYNDMTRRIWELANTTGNHIQLLSLCRNSAEAPSIYRQLVTMAALIQDGKVVAEAHVETGNNWVAAVTSIYQAGDMVVCFASQRAGLLHKPLSQILQSSLKIPIYILSDVHMPEKEKTHWVSQFLAWAGSFGLIAGFFLLQARIVMLPSDWIQNTLLLLLLGAELYLVWFWNSQFG